MFAAAGGAGAQEQPKIHVWPTIDDPNAGGVNELPQNGRADFQMQHNFEVRGQFVCLQPVHVSVEMVQPTDFPAYAGMSLVTQADTVQVFIIPGPQSYPEGFGKLSTDSATFNAVWNTEDAPVNHTHPYTIQMGDVSLATGSPGADCVPTLFNAPDKGNTMINLTYPYYPPEPGATQVPCTEDPSQPQCQDTGAPEEESPGFGAALLVSAIAGALMVARRRGASK